MSVCYGIQLADAVEALGQDVEQEAADELVGWQHHGPVPLAPGAAVVLDAEGHALVGRGNQPAVRDGDAVGVAAEVGARQPPAERQISAGQASVNISMESAIRPFIWLRPFSL